MLNSMTRIFSLLCVAVCLLACFTNCSKKGTAIEEPFIARYKFTAYTIDSFRFRITINDVLVTDSLVSGGEVTRSVNFIRDTVAHLKVLNAANNQVLADTSIILKIGSHIISIVQLAAGEMPVIPALPANEALPAPGNSKIRFQYVKPQPIATLPSSYLPFFDSLQLIIRQSAFGVVAFDTLMIKSYELTSFYEARIGATYNIEVRNAETNFVYNNGTSVTINTTTFPSFNTAILYAYDTLSMGRYRFRLTRIY